MNLEFIYLLRILFWISFLIFNFSYLFRVLILAFLVIFLIIVGLANVLYVKYVIILVYIRGVVVFILYISCICWLTISKFNGIFLLFGFVGIYIYDHGIIAKFTDIGERLWIYLFFSFLFNALVMNYSLNLFKVSGSLRF